ncbi:MAG: valine--tRNA ligase [Phycisphaeraceae bacterium]|nr:valine--tRNA ligase [Phycisphaeraceae bacterium]
MARESYSPSDADQLVAERWQQAKAFHAVPAPQSKGPPFAIFIPPPNVTAALHLGHALNNALQDILVRRARMRGCNTLWMPGTDHAGIATQTVVEKRLLQQGKRRSDFSREEFIAQVQAWKDEYEATILEQLRAIGASCDFDRVRFTMDPVCTAAVRAAFTRLFADGLIDKGKRLVNWDPVSRTALADDEVEMEEIDGFMWSLRYPLADGSGHVTVATTRPETMLGDTAVAVNPRDPRARALRGKRVKLPIVGREIPIVEDDYVVMPAAMAEAAGVPEAAQDPKAAFATGFLKVTPAHDPNDWEIGLRHGLAAINIMAPDASISDRHGWSDVSEEARSFVGLSRERARDAVVEWFRSHGLLEEVRPYRHAVGHSYRSHVPIEPYLSEQWYVLVTDDRLRGAALRAMAPEQRSRDSTIGVDGRSAGDGELHFFPPRYARTFEVWHEQIRDWCISRQLWWGHRIPVWSRGEEALSPEATAALARAPFSDASTPSAGALRRSMIPVESAWSRAGLVHRVRRRDDGAAEELLCVPEAQQAMVPELERAGFRQDDDVLDTWFSSALWPLSTLGWPDPERFGMEGLLETFNPSSVLCTAREIITLWVSRMVMFNRYFNGGRLPFRHVYIHPVVQDGFGQKMSKSLGNGVDPRDIIRTHGADAMRFVLAQIATDTQDVRLPVDLIDPHSGTTFTPAFIETDAGYRVAAPIQESQSQRGRTMVSFYGFVSGLATPTDEVPLALNTSSRFDVGRHFSTKLRNATRFVLASAAAQDGASSTATIDPATRPLIDRWLLSRLARAIGQMDAAIDHYRFSDAVEVLYDIFWRDLCDWYLEGVKPTIRGDPVQEAILLRSLDAILRLAHPICPFVTESLWSEVGPASATRPPVRGLTIAPGELLATASWPVVEPTLLDTEAIATFERVQTLVNLIRNLRGSRQVPPKKRLQLVADRSVVTLIGMAGGVVETLAGLDAVTERSAGSERARGAVPLVFEGGEIDLLGLLEESDAAGERDRLGKRRDELRRAVEGFERKLNNPGYVAKAPPEVVAQTRQMLEGARSDLAAVERSLAALIS